MAYTQYYVDLENGNDSNDGSNPSPFLTLQKAFDSFGSAGGMMVFITGTANGLTAFDVNSSGNNPTLENPIVLRNWTGKTRPNLNFAAGEMFQDSNTLDDMTYWGLNFTFTGEIPQNCFNTSTSSASTHNVWYNNIIDCDGVTSLKEAIHVGQQGRAIGNVCLNVQNGIRVYSTGLVANNFISHKRFGVMVQTAGYAVNNFMLALGGPDPRAAIYMQNTSSAAHGNICYDPTGLYVGIQAVNSKRAISATNNYLEGHNQSIQGDGMIYNLVTNNTIINSTEPYYNMDQAWTDPTNNNSEIVNDQADPNASYLVKQDNGMIDSIDMKKWIAVLSRDVVQQSGLQKMFDSISALSPGDFPKKAEPSVFGSPSEKSETVNPPYFN